MTPRERFIQTLTFGQPDRIPFSPGGPRESTLKAWRAQGLPPNVSWFAHLCEVLHVETEKTRPGVDHGVDFRMIPQFEEKVLEHKDGHYLVQDWKGNLCEISDQFDVTYLRVAKDFVTRRWVKCPVENRDDWERMKTRYALDAGGRFPKDFEERARQLADRDYVCTAAFNGPFWQMREWCGFEGLCMMMVEEPELVREMAGFWSEFVAGCLERIFARAVPDQIHMSEDMAFKAHAMISPAMTRELCQPSYVRWAKLARAAGCPIVGMDSDGYIGELIPIWIESGINVCDPIEVAAHCDILEFRRRFGRRMAYRGGVDKRAMAEGGAAIRAELKRVEPVVRDGGYIPSCDHGVPPDVSWPNFVDYSRLLAQMTGWL
jgi:uroporphyrinogen decarboxylase